MAACHRGVRDAALRGQQARRAASSAPPVGTRFPPADEKGLGTPTGPGPSVCSKYGCASAEDIGRGSGTGSRGADLRAPSKPGILLTTVLGSSMAMLDSTVVNVALPTIGRDLGTGLAALQWTVNAYMLTLAGLIPLGGSLGYRFGRRKIFVRAVWFASASPPARPRADRRRTDRGPRPAGHRRSPGSPPVRSRSSRRPPPGRPARAVGLWSGFGGVGAAVGPFLGGWLVDGPGWRWVFRINVPVALVCAPIAVRHVPVVRRPCARPGLRRPSVPSSAPWPSPWVTYALIEATSGSVLVWVSAVGGVAAGVAFVYVERRRPDPTTPPATSSRRGSSRPSTSSRCACTRPSAVSSS